MPWCPSCKCEYEDGIEECADCHIELVETIEETKLYKNLIKVTNEESTGIVDYLAYSDIDDIKLEDTKDRQVIIAVSEELVPKAKKILSVYLVEQARENRSEHEDEYYINEYETEDLDPADKVSELKSSYISFLVVGVLVEIYAILNIVGVMNIMKKGGPLYTLLVLGIFFVGIGIFTKRSISNVVEDTKSSKDEVERILSEYENDINLNSFYKEHGINVDEIDEGALYFVAIDVIKKDLKNKYPDTKDSIINTVAEDIFGKL